MSLHWKYSPVLNRYRIENLISAPDFEEIVRQIESEMQIVCAVKEPLKQHPFGGHRVAYSLQVNPSTFDLFFNSENGYRAWYFRSPKEGLEKNSYFIRALTPKLLESNVQGEISRKNMIKSLEFSSAKAWFAETGNRLCDRCPGQYYAHDDFAEILNGRWEKSDTLNYPKSRTGRKAPFLNRIRIYGGFIRLDTGREFVPPDKVGRALDIFNFGSS